MIRYVALLRAVNVGGRGKIAMADLRKFGEDLGFEDVVTVLQSGNLVFSTAIAEPDIAGRLENIAAANLGLTTDFIIRSANAWRTMIDANPFPKEAEIDPSHWVAMPLKGSPSEGALAHLVASIVGRERVALIGNTLYTIYPDGIGHSKLTIGAIEKALPPDDRPRLECCPEAGSGAGRLTVQSIGTIGSSLMRRMVRVVRTLATLAAAVSSSTKAWKERSVGATHFRMKSASPESM